MRTSSKSLRLAVFGLFFALTAGVAQADLRVFATVPEWGALAREIGGDKVTVYNATHLPLARSLR